MDAVVLFENALNFFFPVKKISSFEDKLLLNNSKMKNLRGYIKVCISEGIFLMMLAMICFWQFVKADIELSFVCGAIGLFAPFALNYLFQDIKFEKRKRLKEQLLPDLLLEASVFCDESSLLNSLKRFAGQDFPLLKEDFERACTEINNGSSVDEALNRTKKLNKSKAFDRFIDLLLQGYKSGAKLSNTLKETAEDLLEMQGILRERQAVMLVTKYTLILASGLIVPAILGLIIGLVSSLNFAAMNEISLGLSVAERKALFSAAIIGATIYILEYSLLSSYFLAVHEGNKKQFFVYCLMLVPVAITAFTLAQNF